MSSDIQEQQDEEREALQSIYEGDVAFKQINLTTFQYKVYDFFFFTKRNRCSR